jgi:hypothetical protein
MGKHRERTSRGSGKNKQKKLTRTIWAGVEREVKRQEWHQAEKAKSEAEQTAKEVAEQQSQHGNSASSSTDHGRK